MRANTADPETIPDQLEKMRNSIRLGTGHPGGGPGDVDADAD